MNLKAFAASADVLLAEARRVVETKGVEYARFGDVLANLRRGSTSLGVEAESVAMIYASKHWDSLLLFIKTLQEKKDLAEAEKALTEPAKGRILDLINYLLFVNALIEERQQMHALMGAPVVKK